MRRAYTNLGNAHIFLSETAKALEYYRYFFKQCSFLLFTVGLPYATGYKSGSGAAITLLRLVWYLLYFNLH